MWRDASNLPSDAGEVPAPMAGAQRRHKMQTHPAPAFLNEMKRHSFFLPFLSPMKARLTFVAVVLVAAVQVSKSVMVWI